MRLTPQEVSSLTAITDLLREAAGMIDAIFRTSGLIADPEPVQSDNVCWLKSAADKPVISLARPRLATVSVLGRKNAWHFSLNCHAVKDYELSSTDKLSIGVDQTDKLLLIRVDPNGMFPVNFHMGRGKLNGYQISSQMLIQNLEDLGVPLNTKMPIQFDNTTKTWIGKLSEAQPIPVRDHKPKTSQQALM